MAWKSWNDWRVARSGGAQGRGPLTSSDADTRLEGFALGVADYWTKDMSVVDLCDRIEQIDASDCGNLSRPG